MADAYRRLSEGAFAGRPESGVVTVELLVVLGLFVVAVVRGADRGAGSLVGTVRKNEDLPGQACLDDAVGAGCGQIVGAARRRAGEPQRCAIGAGDDLHVHTVLLVFLGVVRLVDLDAVGGDEGAVDNDEIALAQSGQGLVQARRPCRENVQGLVDVPPSRRGRDAETGRELGERLVLSEMGQGEQRLFEATELSPGRVQFTPSGVDEPGDMLDELVRYVEHGRIRNQQGPSVAGVMSEITTQTTRGPALSRPTHQAISPSRHRMKKVH